jgi:hypothetical protein
VLCEHVLPGLGVTVTETARELGVSRHWVERHWVESERDFRRLGAA